MPVLREKPFQAWREIEKFDSADYLITPKRGGGGIIDCVTAFDIETTALRDIEQSIIYAWSFTAEGHITYVGRTWSEALAMFGILSERVGDYTLICYIHNLSYEWQWMLQVFNVGPEDVLLVKKRRPLIFKYKNIEFRCSYLQTNMNLALFAEQAKAKHRKLAGDLDYNIVRYPWTRLSKKEWKYICYDTISLVESIRNEMVRDNDNLATIPWTSTGYVRRDMRKALRPHRKWIEKLMPRGPLYELLHEAFRGGDTHANRYYAGRLLRGVECDDESSAYPAAQVTQSFPIRPFKFIGELDVAGLAEHLKKGHALIMRIWCDEIVLRDEMWPDPYISYSKCVGSEDVILDNGRILRATCLGLSVTDIDLEIILDTYNIGKLYIFDAWYSAYGSLPDSAINVILDYFIKKTTLKGIDWQEELYTKSKNKLNGIYGMSAQDPGKPEITMEDGDYIVQDATIDERLADTKERMVMPYQWGVWTTAHARYALYRAIKADPESAVYWDTDSLYSAAPQNHEKYNREKIKQCKEHGAMATDPTGTVHYLGVFEYDGSYDRFITFGAKKYIKEKNGKVTVTIAGVNKKWGSELVQKLGIDNIRPGFIFKNMNKLGIKYNDHKTVNTIRREGRDIPLYRNAYLYETQYKLSLAEDYEILLKICDDILDNLGDDCYIINNQLM